MQTFDRYLLDSSDRRRVGGPAAHLVNTRHIRDCPVDVDAIHVPEVDVVRVSRGSLALQDPFASGMSDGDRGAVMAWRLFEHAAQGPVECGLNWPLRNTGRTIADFDDSY